MTDGFYCAFENRYRGSIDLIKSRLSVYLPFIEPLKSIYPAPKALDLGCGRGEWLELLVESGFQATGVDLDDDLLNVCQERRLNVIQSDALAYLESVPSESIEIVSAFHLIEHIQFSLVRKLIEHAYRVLKPGGLLILETPNSENLLVGTSSFYLDPTHQKPVPADLLSFTVEYTQFKRTKTLYLQEPSRNTQETINLHDVLVNVSPDYSVVAQKDANTDTLSRFDPVFQNEYGTRLLNSAQLYDSFIKNNFQSNKNTLQLLQEYIEKYSQHLNSIDQTLINEQNRNLLTRNQLKEEFNSRIEKLETLLDATYLMKIKQNETSSLIQKHTEESDSSIANIANKHHSQMISLSETMRNKSPEKQNDTLSNSINQQTLEKLENETALLRNHYDQLSKHSLLLQNLIDKLQNQNNELTHFAGEYQLKYNHHSHHIDKLLKSRSWRYTFICRIIKHYINLFYCSIKGVIKPSQNRQYSAQPNQNITIEHSNGASGTMSTHTTYIYNLLQTELKHRKTHENRH